MTPKKPQLTKNQWHCDCWSTHLQSPL